MHRINRFFFDIEYAMNIIHPSYNNLGTFDNSIRYSRIHTCYFEEMTVHDMKIVFLDDSKEHPIPIKIIPVQQLS